MNVSASLRHCPHCFSLPLPQEGGQLPPTARIAVWEFTQNSSAYACQDVLGLYFLFFGHTIRLVGP